MLHDIMPMYTCTVFYGVSFTPAVEFAESRKCHLNRTTGQKPLYPHAVFPVQYVYAVS